MKRFVIWSPVFVIAAVVLVAAAPSKKSGAVVSTPVESTAPQPAAITPSAVEITTDAVDPDAQRLDPEIAPSTAASSQGGNYSIDWYSINGGGTVNATSTNYRMGASIGQSVAGAATSPNYKMGIGFWYGAGSSGCACDCHADPAPIGACDGVQTVLDVTQIINVAFRGNPAILDPNAGCPYQTTDVNCSTATDVVDVTKMINVAFRGFNPATEFCNPCP